MNAVTATRAADSGQLELTILMPCLNEAETLAACIGKAQGFLQRAGIAGEVLIADNGSTDGSQEIATGMGARVVPVGQKGYGAALLGGIAAARGRFVIMGDADDSYDFGALGPFVARLRDGADLVMGNRFQGGIAAGAMPVLHRYLGNPVLSFLGRLFFRIGTGDFHCGLRGFNAEAIRRLAAPGLARPDRPTAVFAVNDVIAVALMQQAIELRLTIPGDLSILGFNDLDVANYVRPALTTLRTPAAAMGARAVEVLVDAISGKPLVSTALLPIDFVARDSTGPAPGASSAQGISA